MLDCAIASTIAFARDVFAGRRVRIDRPRECVGLFSHYIASLYVLNAVLLIDCDQLSQISIVLDASMMTFKFGSLTLQKGLKCSF
jgi:hypothetical protein